MEEGGSSSCKVLLRGRDEGVMEDIAQTAGCSSQNSLAVPWEYAGLWVAAYVLMLNVGNLRKSYIFYLGDS